jgi:hypothetical protein
LPMLLNNVWVFKPCIKIVSIRSQWVSHPKLPIGRVW